MSTLIDELVVSFGLDPAKFTAGQKQTVEDLRKLRDQAMRTAKEMEFRGKQAAEFFTQMRNQLIGLFALFTAGKGFRQFVEETTKSDAALGRFSARIGLSVRDAAAWRAAIEQVGGTADDVFGSMQNLASAIAEYSIGGSSAIVEPLMQLQKLAQVPLNLADFVDQLGRIKPDALIKLAEVAERIQPALAVPVLQKLGLSQSTIDMVLKGGDAVRRLYEEGLRIREVTAADVAAAEERQKAWSNFTNVWRSLGRIIETDLTPILVRLLQHLDAIAKWFQEHPRELEAAFAALTLAVSILSTGIVVSLIGTALRPFAVILAYIAAGSLPPLLLNLALLTARIPLLSSAFLWLAAVIEATPVGWIITGLAAIGAAAWLLYSNWDWVWLKIKEIAAAAWGSIEKGFHGLVDALAWMGNWVALFAKGQWAEAWDSMRGPAGSFFDWFITKLSGWAGALKGAALSALGIPSSGPPVGAPRNRLGGMLRPKAVTIGGLPPSVRGQAEADVVSFMGMDWSRNDAVAIVANLYRESTLSASAENRGHYGLAQWDAARQRAFRRWTGHDIRSSTRAEQLAFVDYELRGPEAEAGRALVRAGTPSEKAAIFSRLYERPGSAMYEAETRAALAAAMVTAAPQYASMVGSGKMGGSTYDNRRSSNVETNIGTVVVQTRATDAEGIAQDIGPAIRRNTFVQSGNYGPD